MLIKNNLTYQLFEILKMYRKISDDVYIGRNKSYLPDSEIKINIF